MSDVKPSSVTDEALGVPRVTPTPPLGLAGAVGPRARRTITSARSESPGLVHDSEILEAVRVPAASPVTPPGGVVSAGGGGGVVGSAGGGVCTGGGVSTGAGGKATDTDTFLPALTFTLPRLTVAPGAETLYAPAATLNDFEDWAVFRNPLPVTVYEPVPVSVTCSVPLAFFFAAASAIGAAGTVCATTPTCEARGAA